MQATSLNPKQKVEVRAQVSQFLAKSQAFSGLSPSQREQVIADTGKVVEAMAEGRAASDPYAIAADSAGGGRVSTAGGQIGQQIGTTAGNLLQKQVAPTGSIIDVGVQEAAKMIREINFPDFVAKLIEGTFHAIVKSSIEQMRAYADMVRSVSTSLNDFRDRNTTENQAMDHLVSRYPSLLQVQLQDGRPSVTVKEDADTDNLPNFQKDLGLSEPVSDLDDDTIREKLVPAARDDLARGRQQLLATIILMGINRIVVTDGRISAKIRFNFSARESRNVTASAYDYAYVGQKATSTRTLKNVGDQSDGGSPPVDTSKWSTQEQQNYANTQMYYQNLRNRYAIGYDEQSSIEPDVRVTSEYDLQQQGNIQAAGQVMGEVSVNFKSDTFPLEKLVGTDQLQKLTQAQGMSAGSPPPPAPGSTPAGLSTGAGKPAGAATGSSGPPPP